VPAAALPGSGPSRRPVEPGLIGRVMHLRGEEGFPPRVVTGFSRGELTTNSWTHGFRGQPHAPLGQLPRLRSDPATRMREQRQTQRCLRAAGLPLCLTASCFTFGVARVHTSMGRPLGSPPGRNLFGAARKHGVADVSGEMLSICFSGVRVSPPFRRSSRAVAAKF
jgi:hypothetical protein